jgi:parallel beta-helix repeat protein
VFPIHLKPGIMLRGDESQLGVNHQIVGGGAYISPTLGRQSIAILADTGAEIRGVSIKNEGRRGYAIWVESAAPRIIANTLSGNVHDGIFFAGQSRGWVEGNRFYKNGANGVSILGTSTPIIVNNLFQETGFGITVDQRSSPRLENNRVFKNRSGIIVGGSATPLIRGNLISENQDAGLVAITQAQPDLGSLAAPGNNIFEDNGNFDINNATRGGLTLAALGNRLRPEAVKGNVELGGQPTLPQYVGTAPEAMSISDLPADVPTLPTVAQPNPVSAPTTPVAVMPTLPQPATQAPAPSTGERIRILVTPKAPDDLAKLQKHIPSAVAATLNGRPVLVAGLYDSRAQAMKVMDDLTAAGFDAIAEVISAN